VGEALNNYRYKNQKHGLDVPCIGIGSWGYTTGNEMLDDYPGSSSARTSVTTKGSRTLAGHLNQAIHAVQMVS
jgi:hypothetical protein